MKLVERARRRLQILTARDWGFAARGQVAVDPPRAHWVIAPRPMASIDYYLADLLAEPGGRVTFDSDIERWARRATLPKIEPFTRVVLVRMPDPRWAAVLDELRGAFVDVVWFVDDDVPAARQDSTLPVEYRLRVLSDYLHFKGAFERTVGTIWASTPTVAARFPHARVEVRGPSGISPIRARRDWVTVFYHGTASHRGEHLFLKRVFEDVQAASPRTVIEVCGDHELKRLYKGIPRLRVVHPIPWPDYLPLLQAGRYDIGLVPLLDTPFNRGRAGIKALEIAAIGATGVLSRRPPYLDYAHLPRMHFVSDEPSLWVEMILALVDAHGADRPNVERHADHQSF